MKYFETIKCFDNEAFHLKYHQKRISNTIGKNFDLAEYIYPTSDDLLRCKVIYNHNEILYITYTPYFKKNKKIFQLVYDDDIKYDYKYLNRENLDILLASKSTAQKDLDEIIIIQNNYVTDTTIANIAVFLENHWYTPKKPLLYGTTRQRYLEKSVIKELDISVEMLLQAEKIALLNAMVDFDIINEFKLLV